MVKKNLIGFFGLVFLAVIGGYLYYRLVVDQPPPILAADRRAVSLMPLLANLKLGDGRLALPEGLCMTFSAYRSERLERAAARFARQAEMLLALDAIAEPEAGLVIAVVPPIRRLVEGMP